MFQVAKFYETGSSELAVRRLPALSVTMVLEICGGIVIKQFAEVRLIKNSNLSHCIIDSFCGYQNEQS